MFKNNDALMEFTASGVEAEVVSRFESIGVNLQGDVSKVESAQRIAQLFMVSELFPGIGLIPAEHALATIFDDISLEEIVELTRELENDELEKLPLLFRRYYDFTLAAHTYLGSNYMDVALSYGTQMPFFAKELGSIASETSDPTNTKHLLTGAQNAGTAREFNYTTGLFFPDSTRVALDLEVEPHTAGGLMLAADAAEMPFPDETFDTVQATDLLHMLIPPDRKDLILRSGADIGTDRTDLIEKYLAEVKRVLKPGGSYVMNEYHISVPLNGKERKEVNLPFIGTKSMRKFASLATKQGLDSVTYDTRLYDMPRALFLSIMGQTVDADTAHNAANTLTYIDRNARFTGKSKCLGARFVKPLNNS